MFTSSVPFILYIDVKYALAYLGGDISAKIFNTGATGDFIKQSTDLYCDGLSKCRWHNIGDEDALDWATGLGIPNPDRLLLVTGSAVTPGWLTR